MIQRSEWGDVVGVATGLTSSSVTAIYLRAAWLSGDGFKSILWGALLALLVGFTVAQLLRLIGHLRVRVR